MDNKGLVYVFTGEGKGKTSAALGVATRSLLLDKRVVWVSLYKGEDWELSEKKLVDKFSNLEMQFCGRGFRIPEGKKVKNLSEKLKIAKIASEHVVIDKASEEEHTRAAEEGLRIAREKLEDKPFLLVLDEVLNAVSENLLSASKVLEFLDKRGETHIVLTGRVGTDPARTILAGADLVTECRKIKHPYDEGKLAVRGLDY